MWNFFLSITFLKAVLNCVSKFICVCFLFCFTTLCNWLKTRATFSTNQKNKTNRDLLALIFPRLAPVT